MKNAALALFLLAGVVCGHKQNSDAEVRALLRLAQYTGESASGYRARHSITYGEPLYAMSFSKPVPGSEGELLGDLNHAAEVYFSSGQILEDRIVRGLCRMSSLVTVLFKDAEVSPEHLRQLGKCARIEHLRLHGAAITDEHVRSVSNSFSRLQFLDLSNARITDGGICALAGLPALREIDVSGTRLSDASIPCFRTMPALERLNTTDTRISESGRSALAPRVDAVVDVPARQENE